MSPRNTNGAAAVPYDQSAQCGVLAARLRAVTFLAFGLATATPSWAEGFSVSAGGVPTYSQSIAVPPGVAGMSPTLALTYAGDAPNGPVGRGWSLQGPSMITRCPATLAIDGRKLGVDFGVNDKLCLDGQRLVALDASGNALVGAEVTDAGGLAAGTYREYRTEIDNYARVRAYGYANGDVSGKSGPAFFKLWSKGGQVYEYGDGPSKDASTKALVNVQGSNVAMVWAVARASDVAGNCVDFKYEQRDVAWGSGPGSTPASGHEWNLLEVQYSGNKVVFTYDAADARPDKSEAYQLGFKNVNVRLLKSITTYTNSSNRGSLGPDVGAVAVKTVKLTHDNGPVSHYSRVSKIQECAGDISSTRCLPSTSFTYSPGGTDAYVSSAAFNQSSLVMQNIGNTYGVIVGDFNGDGRTDFIRWSDLPAQNQLSLSNGDGSFSQATNFNITTQNLLKSDGCYISYAVDINGDGLPDILRYSAPTSPAGTACIDSGPVLMFLNNGDGSFVQTAYSGPTLKQDLTTNFFLLDFNGDGKVDLITSIAGSISNQYFPPLNMCVDPSGLCTHVYSGNGNGTFKEFTLPLGPGPLAYAPIGPSTFYSKPGGLDVNAPTRIADMNGDGLQDLAGWMDNAGTQIYGLRSRGDGNFYDFRTTVPGACISPIDFNGDGRNECLWGQLSGASSNVMTLRQVAWSSHADYVDIAGFNLTAPNQLIGIGIGFTVADVNGDGRQDIIRWKDDASQNVVYLSNGDGTFTTSTTFNLAGTQLKKSDGTANFIVGDFTGRNNAEILRIQTVNGVATNSLYVKQETMPPDQLLSVTSGFNATTSLVHVSLSNPRPLSGGPSADLGPRYASDRGTSNATIFPLLDLTYPKYVVATVVSDSGVGASRVNTEYSYFGLKFDALGRGALGFREVRRQILGADGNPLTAATQYLQSHPYIGVVANNATYHSALNSVSAGTILTNVSNVYCDQAAAVGSDVAALTTKVSCTAGAKIQRPYLLLSSQTGQDLNGAALPTTTTQASVNATGDPTKVVVTTTGSAIGVAQTFVKIVDNQYLSDNTACNPDNLTCKWILGRLQQSKVTDSVPNSLSSIATTAGTGAYAAATNGASTFPVVPISPAVLMSILQLLLSDD